MNITALLSALVFGTLAGNVILVSGIGLDLTSNNLNSIKNSLIFSLFVFGSLLVSGVFMYLARLALLSLDLGGFFVVVSLMIVAIIVQISEYLMMKLAPIVYTHVKDILVVLIPTLAIILLSLFSNGIKFGELILNIIFTSIGMIAVMTTISGVRQNKLTYATYDVFRGNLMTLVVLFVLALVWTAV